MKEIVAVSITLKPSQIPPTLSLNETQIKELVTNQIQKERSQLAVRTSKLVSGGTTGTNWNPQRSRVKALTNAEQEIGATRLWVFITVDDPQLDYTIKNNIVNASKNSGHDEITIPFSMSTKFTIEKVELRGVGRTGIILSKGNDGYYNLDTSDAFNDEILNRFLHIASSKKSFIKQSTVKRVHSDIVILAQPEVPQQNEEIDPPQASSSLGYLNYFFTQVQRVLPKSSSSEETREYLSSLNS